MQKKTVNRASISKIIDSGVKMKKKKKKMYADGGMVKKGYKDGGMAKKDPNKGITALREEAPQAVKAMGFAKGGMASVDNCSASGAPMKSRTKVRGMGAATKGSNFYA